MLTETPLASVVARGDAPPILEPSEAVLDLVPLSILDFVVGDRGLPPFPGWDAWLDPFFLKGIAIPVRVITSVGQHAFGRGQTVQQRPCAYVIAALTRRQEHPQRTTQSIRDGVQFRVHPALGAPDQAAAPPFFRPRLEAVRCVFRWVASIINVSVCCP